MSVPFNVDHPAFKVLGFVIGVCESKYTAMLGLLLMGAAMTGCVELGLHRLVSRERVDNNENRLFIQNQNHAALAAQRELNNPELGGMGSACCIQ
ncbi:MAG: hypothetical protein P1U40_11530 [Coxiellaceae bacterium]|nr:hypothetical protein [Coxiellaceae bacterium]